MAPWPAWSIQVQRSGLPTEENMNMGSEYMRRHVHEGEPGFGTSTEMGIRWVPGGRCIVICGRHIDGMVYVGRPTRTHVFPSRSVINPNLRVAEMGPDTEGMQLPRWPSYAEISPAARATYLDWLAGGGTDPSCDVGYMFLYFYGLERRFLKDNAPVAERRQILAEVIRLRDLFCHNGSVRRYLGEFIEVARVYLDDPSIYDPVLERVGRDVPYSMKFALGSALARGELLTANQLLGLFLNHPGSRLRASAERCSEEFQAHYRLRFVSVVR